MKNIILIIFIGIISIYAWQLNNPTEKSHGVINETAIETFPPLSNFQLIGHEDNILKGAAFSSPDEENKTKSLEWKQRPIKYLTTKGKEADLTITLDQQLYELFYNDIQQFAQEKNINIAVSKGTCGISSKKLNEKSIDLGGFCCPPATADRLPGLKYHTLGISSIALITHFDNKINTISTDQARQIFAGNIRRWNELPSKASKASILPITRLHCKSRPGHWSLILGKEDAFSPMIQPAGDIPFMLTQVSRQQQAIGYETLHMIKKENKRINILRINQISPEDTQALAKGAYPFYRVFNVTTWTGDNKNPLAYELMTFLSHLIIQNGNKYKMVSIKTLAENGWLIKEGELIGEPGSKR